VIARCSFQRNTSSITTNDLKPQNRAQNIKNLFYNTTNVKKEKEAKPSFAYKKEKTAKKAVFSVLFAIPEGFIGYPP